MSSRGNHALICTVVFIDIVEYSKKSVTDQMQIKEQFNALLAQALADVPNSDRIILDTGDGAAISFLGDPEEGLYLGLALRDTLNPSGTGALRLRTGINLGPVRLVKDINNQPNIIGDGINVAQRVMSFAEINQVLASRSYYEVISALSADYAHLFSFEGARTDKHVREHEVYALGDEPAPARAPRTKAGPAAVHAAAAMHKIGAAANLARAQIMRRPPLATALAVVLILGTAIALRLALRGADTGADAEIATYKSPARPVLPPTTVKRPPSAPAPAAIADAAPAPPPKTKVTKKPPQTRAQEDAAPLATGMVRLNVIPWGEVFIDGNKYGTAPPLRDIAIKPGIHKIEVRNPGFASYLQVVEIKAGEEIRIRHRFR
jgi:class 3 adenylate cyclase